MSYKIGDRVKIKNIDWYNKNKDQYGKVACGYHVFTEEMSKFCGFTMIVCRRSNLGVMTMGGSASYWTDEMIEGLAEIKKNNMENFMGQLILDNEIDYEAAREHIKNRIKAFTDRYVYNCCPKEYRQSDEWKYKDLSEKLSMALQYSNIDDFIEYLIDK